MSPSNAQLYHNPSLSWEDDKLLLFDDGTTTPRDPAVIGDDKPIPKDTQPHSKMTIGSAMGVPSISRREMQLPSSSAMDRRLSACSTKAYNNGGASNASWLPTWLVKRWGYCVLGLSLLLLIVAAKTSRWLGGVEEQASIIDLLYWSLTSFTTIGPVSASHSFLLKLLTIIYAILGVTSLGVFWGRYGQKILERGLAAQRQRQEYLQSEVFNVLCDLSSRASHGVYSSSKPRHTVSASSLPISRRFVWLCFFSGAAALLAVEIGVTSGWNPSQTLYYTMTATFTLGDSTTASMPQVSKLLSLFLIPLLITFLLRWMVAVADQVVKSTSANPCTFLDCNDTLSSSDLMRLLEEAGMEDGLLTRADFLEIMLLAMKKVDPELLSTLRSGFEKVTHGGSVDLTRKQWVNAATVKVENA